MVCMAPDTYWLTNWSIHSDRRGRMYVVGDLPDGRLWETSTVLSIQSTDTHYIVYTNNSVYSLYW
jgi:hypothetical protein